MCDFTIKYELLKFNKLKYITVPNLEFLKNSSSK